MLLQMARFPFFLLKDIFARYKIFVWQLFFFSLWKYYPTAFWLPKFLMRNLLIILLRNPLFVMSCSFLAASKILFLSLAFNSLIMSGCELFVFILLGVCWASWMCRFMCFSSNMRNLGFLFLQFFFFFLCLSSPSEDPIMWCWNAWCYPSDL